jgi:hypothetical protein
LARKASLLYKVFIWVFLLLDRTKAGCLRRAVDHHQRARAFKAMKVFFLSTFAIFFAMSTTMPSALLSAGLAPLQEQLAKLEAIAQERAKLFAELFDAGEAEATGKCVEPVARTTGLQTSGLRTGSTVTGSVQGASGLHSGASGLTPESEWRKRFPRKPGQ